MHFFSLRFAYILILSLVFVTVQCLRAYEQLMANVSVVQKHYFYSEKLAFHFAFGPIHLHLLRHLEELLVLLSNLFSREADPPSLETPHYDMNEICQKLASEMQILH